MPHNIIQFDEWEFDMQLIEIQYPLIQRNKRY